MASFNVPSDDQDGCPNEFLMILCVLNHCLSILNRHDVDPTWAPEIVGRKTDSIGGSQRLRQIVFYMCFDAFIKQWTWMSTKPGGIGFKHWDTAYRAYIVQATVFIIRLIVGKLKSVSICHPFMARHYGCHFADDIQTDFLLWQQSYFCIQSNLNCVLKSKIYNKPVLGQVMACCGTGHKPFSEPI